MSRRQLLIAVAIPVITAVAVFLLGAGLVRALPDQYSANTSVVFSPKVGDAGLTGPDTVILTANTALQLTTSDPVLQAAARVAGATPSEVAGWTSASIAPSTATVLISVTAPDGQQAALVANSLADQLVAQFATSQLVEIEQFGAAVAPKDPSGPPRTIFLLVVAVFAALVAVLALAAIYSFWRVRLRGGLLAVTESMLTRESLER